MTQTSSRPAADTAALAQDFALHADWCRSAGAHLYAALLDGMAGDLAAGGVVADLLADRAGAGGAFTGLHLRLLAALHEVVLAGHAPALEPYYPTVGGTWPPDDVWPAAASVLTEHAERVRGWLDVAPQTNEVGRSAALAVGLLTAAASHGLRRVRLLQLGASAGLHLLVDSFRLAGDGWGWGPLWSPVDLGPCVRGALPLTPAGVPADDLSRVLTVVERRGCDVAPVDVRDPAGRRRLQAFVWPEDDVRHERLAAALELAEDAPPPVDAADAVTWLGERLAEPVADDVLTVVWSSVTLQYLDPADRRTVGALVARARDERPVSQVALESDGSHYTSPPLLTVDGRTLGSSPPHGIPLTLR